MLPVPVLVAFTLPKEPDSTTSPVLRRAARQGQLSGLAKN